MTRQNPDLWPEDAVVDDLSSTNKRKTWSSEKLWRLFGSFLDTVTPTAGDTVAPTIDLGATSISSTEAYYHVEVFPSNGVLALIPDKIRLLDATSQEVTLTAEPELIPGDLVGPSESGKVFLRLHLPIEILPNTTYTLEIDEGGLLNGNKHNLAISLLLTSSIITFVKPTFGTAVTIPADANHNFLGQIQVPISSNHSGRTLYFDATKIDITGGAFTLVSKVWNQSASRIELNVTPDTMTPNTSYDIEIQADCLIDDDLANIPGSVWGNDADTKMIMTPPEQLPEYSGGLQTNSGDTNVVNITDIYFPLLSKSYLNLQRDPSKFFTIRIGGSSEDIDFVVNPTLERVEIDLALAATLNPSLVPNFITPDNKLNENTLYEFDSPAGAVIDGAETSALANFSFNTDDEADIVLGNMTNDNGDRAFGLSTIYVHLLGGPTFNNPPTVDFSGVTINGTTANIAGGTGAISYNAGLQRIEIPVQNLVSNAPYVVVIPQDAIMDGTSGHVAFTDTLNTLAEAEPVLTASSVTGSVVNYKTVSQIVVTVDSLAYSGPLDYDSSKLQIFEGGSPLAEGVDYTTSYDDGLKQILISGLGLKYSTSYNVTFLVDAIADGFTGNSTPYSFPFTTANRFNYAAEFGTSDPVSGSTDVDYITLNNGGSYFRVEIQTASMHDIAYAPTPTSLSDVLTVVPGNITVTEDAVPVAFTADISGMYLRIQLTGGYQQDKTYEVNLAVGAVTDGPVDSLVAGPYSIDTIDAAAPSYLGTLNNPSGASAAIQEFTGSNRIVVGITPASYGNLQLNGAFPHGISVSGATLDSVSLNPTLLEIELEVSSVVLGLINITMGAGSIIDTIYPNATPQPYSFTAVAAATPVIDPAISTDTANNVSFDIAELWLDITSSPHAALTLEPGADIKLRRYTSPTTFFEGDLNVTRINLNTGASPYPRLEIDFRQFDSFTAFNIGTHSDLLDTSNGYRLYENAEYRVVVFAGSVTDLSFSNATTTSNPINTDDEQNPVFNTTIDSDGSESASLITEFIVEVSNGPFVNILQLDMAQFPSVSVINFTDTGTVTRGGDPYLTFVSSVYRIHIPVVAYNSPGGVLPGKDYKVELPAGLLNDGTQGNAYFLSDAYSVLPETVPTFDPITPSGTSVDYHFPTTDRITIPITSATYSNLQANAALLVLEEKPVGPGSWVPVTAGITKVSNLGTPDMQILLTDGVLQFGYEYRVTIPAGTVTDGNVGNTITTHTFQTTPRTEVVPVFDFANATPPNGAIDVDPNSVFYLDIPFSSLHEAFLTVNDAGSFPKFHLNDGTSDLSIASVVRMGATLSSQFIRITTTLPLPAGETLTLGIDADAIQDGATGNVAVTLGSAQYQISIEADTVERRTVVVNNTISAPASIFGNSNGADAFVYASGTRSFLAIDLTQAGYESTGDFFYGVDFDATPRRFHFIKIKPSGNTSAGQTITPEALAAKPTLDAGAQPVPSNSFGGAILDVNSGPSSLNRFQLVNSPTTDFLYELVVFDSPKTLAEAQTWADAQNWDSYKTL